MLVLWITADATPSLQEWLHGHASVLQSLGAKDTVRIGHTEEHTAQGLGRGVEGGAPLSRASVTTVQVSTPARGSATRETDQHTVAEQPLLAKRF